MQAALQALALVADKCGERAIAAVAGRLEDSDSDVRQAAEKSLAMLIDKER